MVFGDGWRRNAFFLRETTYELGSAYGIYAQVQSLEALNV